MTIDHNAENKMGIVPVTPQDILEGLLSGGSFSNVSFNDHEEIQEYNKQAQIFDLPLLASCQSISHVANQKNWNMPDKYKHIDVIEFLLNKCKTDEERERVAQELVLFDERDMFDVIRYLIYLVDVMREHKIVWGVGRGSSVSSFVLYLIGIHKINSLEYKLDIREFLK